MKILDIPQSGKRGLTVSQNGRYGQISRTLAIPTNPRTAAQSSVRAILATATRSWGTLTDAQRAAWRAAALNRQTRSRLGQSGPMTGCQFYTKINATLANLGQATVDAPPATPTFDPLAPQNLTITDHNNVIALKLTCPTDPGQNTIVRGGAPQSAGVDKYRNLRILGACPTPITGASDITALYTAKFGVPAVGQRVFVSCCQMVNGFESVPVSFSAVVPASS